MIAIKDIQTTVSAAVEAHAYFAAAPSIKCVADDGTKEGVIEDALRNRGAVSIVPHVLRGVRKDGMAGKVLLEAEIVVRVQIAPQVNNATGKANRNIYEMVRAVSEAVLRIAPTAGGKKFATTDEFLQLTTSDEGTITYDVFFSVLTSLN